MQAASLYLHSSTPEHHNAWPLTDWNSGCTRLGRNAPPVLTHTKHAMHSRLIASRPSAVLQAGATLFLIDYNVPSSQLRAGPGVVFPFLGSKLERPARLCRSQPADKMCSLLLLKRGMMQAIHHVVREWLACRPGLLSRSPGRW